jgi:glutamyl-tRNA reductase
VKPSYTDSLHCKNRPAQGVVYVQRNVQNAPPFWLEIRMHRVLVLGAGKIGALISGLLAESGNYQVNLADVSLDAARAVARAHGRRNLTAHALDAADETALARHLGEHRCDAVIRPYPS